MMTEQNEILMSQMADGELTGDQTNELLLNVLDAPDEREKLKQVINLRRVTSAWRLRQPDRPMVIVSQKPTIFHHRRLMWRLGSMAVAACVGGLLVLAGLWAAGGFGARQVQTLGPDSSLATSVTTEQMQQVAKVFALHESVAGPLAWYAADDQNIRLASARGTEVSQAPIGVLLKLESATPGTTARTLVIVCRNDQPAVIELPAEIAGQAGLRVYLMPSTVSGKVDMQYAIAMDGQPQQAPLASLTGQRRLGLAETSLGQLAMGDKMLNVEAAAWPMRQERN